MIRSYVNIHPRFIRSAARPRPRPDLQAGNLVIPCALGRSGPRHGKREGDGASPVGRFGLLQAFYRADRLARPRTGLRCGRIRPARRLVATIRATGATTASSRCPAPRATRRCGGTTTSTTW